MALATPGIGNRIFMNRTRTLELKSPYGTVRMMGKIVHMDRGKIRGVVHIVRESPRYVREESGEIDKFWSERVDFAGGWR